MVTVEQQQRILKAKVALALYAEFGKVPKEAEIEYTYHLARVLSKAALGTRYLKRQQQKNTTLRLAQPVDYRDPHSVMERQSNDIFFL